MNNIRNFCIIAHIDHGKSTLADRLLEITGTIEKRKMQNQVLDSMELERERGITIKMTPVRMLWKPPHSDRGLLQTETQKNADKKFLYGDLTYKLRGIFFEVKKKIGLGHKEGIYHNALEIEFAKAGIAFESKKNIPILYEGKSIGTYQPDFVIEDKVIIELKALPEIARPQIEQVWSYLKGCSYKLALLVNYGSTDIDIKRIVYDTARDAEGQRNSASSLRNSAGASNQVEYIFNLIDTPGHIDFAYEVSRAMKAVEGAIVLVDATQGVQAQTISVLGMAQEAGLTIIPAVNKIDSPLAQVPETKKQIAELCGVSESDVLLVSGKTGVGVLALLEAVIQRIPPPQSARTYADGTPTNADQRLLRDSASSQRESAQSFRGLIFDFKYSNHAGVIVYLRSFNGSTKRGDKLRFAASEQDFTVIEAGIFSPGETPVASLSAGEIGYLVTGIKEPGIASVGDTILSAKGRETPLPGYDRPKPVVWASIYPESQDDFTMLRQAVDRLRLSDSSFTYEEEAGGLLGRGFRCGFLGMLHLEIITERLRREFNLSLVVTTPSITYEVVTKRGKRDVVYSAARFPDYGDIAEVYEPWVEARIITPGEYIVRLMPMLYDHEAFLKVTEDFGNNRNLLVIEMPLRELMRGFFDDVKSLSSGFASLSYKILELRKADVVKLELLVTEEVVQAFSRIVSRKRVELEAEAAVEKLHGILPAQLFATKIQGQALGRIISSRTVRATQKTLGDFGKNGGDRTRKMKLWQNQKEGKKRLEERGVGKVRIPQEVFLKMVRKD